MDLETFVSHYFLAEKGYEQEMNFFGKKRTILENKVVAALATTTKSKNETMYSFFIQRHACRNYRRVHCH